MENSLYLHCEGKSATMFKEVIAAYSKNKKHVVNCLKLTADFAFSNHCMQRVRLTCIAEKIGH
jgi:hypothetical protein